MVFLTAVDPRRRPAPGPAARVGRDAGNDHRLGANEAPPAIISIFLGSQLEEVDRGADRGPRAEHAPRGGELRLGVTTLPPLPRDTDRPQPHLALRLHRQQVRVPRGRRRASRSPYPNTILNTIVAESLDYIATEIETRGGTGDRREVIQALVRETLTQAPRILFNGDNYSAEWVQEAERRGLSNFSDTPSALAQLRAPRRTSRCSRSTACFTRARDPSRARTC